MSIKAASKAPEVKAFFDHDSNTVSYVVSDLATKKAAIIDSVMGFDYASGRISYDHADRIIDYVTTQKLNVEWLIESHVHADHLSAAPYIQQKLGGKLGISDRISEVQKVFGKIFNAGTEFERDGSQFDKLFADGDRYKIGELDGVAIATPGHTPACMVHLIGDAVFVGDTLFMPDGGTARADFPGGDARTLFQSIQKILALPDEMRMFVCHDYAPNGREFLWETTVGAQRANNIHVGNNASEDGFVEMREKRDASLAMPRLILPSIQVNMRAGHMPDAEENGATYLKVPIQGLKG
jgi:glyoxylase-like metal-dependent hydrolase (beta-lactamase superfamily II)